MRKKLSRIKNLKFNKKLVCLTAYSKPIAKLLDNHCDIILVGDSMATAFYGMKDTKSISLQTCLLYTSPSPRDRTRSRMPSSA